MLGQVFESVALADGLHVAILPDQHSCGAQASAVVARQFKLIGTGVQDCDNVAWPRRSLQFAVGRRAYQGLAQQGFVGRQRRFRLQQAAQLDRKSVV